MWVLYVSLLQFCMYDCYPSAFFRSCVCRGTTILWLRRPTCWRMSWRRWTAEGFWPSTLNPTLTANPHPTPLWAGALQGDTSFKRSAKICNSAIRIGNSKMKIQAYFIPCDVKFWKTYFSIKWKDLLSSKNDHMTCVLSSDSFVWGTNWNVSLLAENLPFHSKMFNSRQNINTFHCNHSFMVIIVN